MVRFLQTVIGGLTIGGVYAVIAVALNLQWSASGVLNLAVAEFAVLGALITIELHDVGGLNLVLTVLLVLAGAFLLGIGEHEVVLGRMRRGRRFSTMPFVITLGFALVLRGLAERRWGRDFFSLPSFSGNAPLRLGDVRVPTQSLWVLGTAILVSLILWALFRYTLWGKAFQSCADNREAASLMGINPGRVTRFTFGIGGLLAALAGIVIAPIAFISYQSGLPLLLNCFIAAAIGGFGRTSGAVVGGVLVGLLSALASGYVSSLYADAFVFALLLVVLVVRPAGILGSAVDVAKRA